LAAAVKFKKWPRDRKSSNHLTSIENLCIAFETNHYTAPRDRQPVTFGDQGHFRYLLCRSSADRLTVD
jgi:hypothetical protein